MVVFLDHRNHLLAYEILQEGTVDHTAVYPREILKRALEFHATGLVLAHNHPAGSLEPSEGDKALTRQILAASRALGVTVHDHLILAAEGHFSFRQAGLLVLGRVLRPQSRTGLVIKNCDFKFWRCSRLQFATLKRGGDQDG